MKIRNGFVTNSSSTNFTITNKTKRKKTLVDFVIENPQLLEMYNERYGSLHADGYSTHALLESARENNITFPANSSGVYGFGDEDGTLVGAIFDYILRDGGSSISFTWEFHSYNR